ncbi:zinc finger CCHC domain-containing protein 7-like, partial [Salvelinus fontinalis]|uniref:zinc finger CCHC domain-containing protein 7-like n=1 Tax=Salvelinus fontinalis TaxID=8038 RepID=UPI0024867446
MFGGYVDRAELEDELYGEESEGSEVDGSELEFRLYSQLHYSSNPGEREEEEEEGEEDRRLSSSHGENPGEREEEEDGSKAKRQQPPKSHDHGNRDLRKHLLGDTEQKKPKVKQKTQQGMKQQRGLSKGDPRRQRLFQEVIVIDSGQDDVITVSDNTEEDDGVCAVKGQRSKTGPPQASTTAPQRNPAPKRRCSVVDSDSVVVLDSVVLDSGADSDSLESWMILGSGKQDGDQDIILNLEGEGDI